MGKVEEAVQVFADLAGEQGLRDCAVAACREALLNCAVEERELGLQELGGWSIEEIELHFDKCSVVFSHGVLNHPYIDTQIGLYIKDDGGVVFRNLNPIGTYRLITMLDGEINDDYLVIDREKKVLTEPEDQGHG
jgi:hypothetical protein